jgi:hypothetical protein
VLDRPGWNGASSDAPFLRTVPMLKLIALVAALVNPGFGVSVAWTAQSSGPGLAAGDVLLAALMAWALSAFA